MGVLPAGVSIADVYSPANRARVAVWTWKPAWPGPHPLLVLLHGVNDAAGHNWFLKARVHDIASRILDVSPTDQPVIIAPSDTGILHGSAWADWSDGSAKAETWLMQELLSWADVTFPLDGRRWITGLSMGGYAALTLALRHPMAFSSATAMSGYFRPDQLYVFVDDDSRRRIWAGEAAELEHDPTHLVLDANRRAGLQIAFGCGTADSVIESNRAFARHLHRHHIAHLYEETQGGHDWSYWSGQLPRHLKFHVAGTWA
nr:alpha/beta hydrolase-fold protein [Kribbella pittospori]